MQLSISILGAMELSVLIPTYRRPDKLEKCLRALLPQIDPSRHEIIVGIDGGERQDLPEELVGSARFIDFPKVGYIAVRRALMELANGRIVLWMNDDSYASPTLVSAHLKSHHQCSDPRIVVGHSIWKPVVEPTLFDRLVQESDLVFFGRGGKDQLTQLGFRDCYGLNMSFPKELAGRLGGVPQMPDVYGYDDIELAYRMIHAGAAAIFEPTACIVHDHRYEPLSVHRREYLLGRAAWAYANVNPTFAAELFRLELGDIATLDRFESVIQLEWRDALRIERSFMGLAELPPAVVHADLLPVLAEQWVLLKRLLWRWGVLDASRGIESRWSLLAETSPDQVLRAASIPV